MPNPKRRHSKQRRNTRRSANWKMESKSLGLCSQCRQPKLPHRVCPNCGHYDGKEVIAADEA